jgi:hypothetical protein
MFKEDRAWPRLAFLATRFAMVRQKTNGGGRGSFCFPPSRARAHPAVGCVRYPLSAAC